MATERVLEQLKNIGEGINKTKALLAGANIIVDRAKEIVPVDTGTLRDSIEALEIDGDVYIHASADQGGGEYSAFVEFGTVKMSAQPYVRPAIDEKLREVEQMVGSNIQIQILYIKEEK
jgi:HK97 gp10 family phage protein